MRWDWLDCVVIPLAIVLLLVLPVLAWSPVVTDGHEVVPEALIVMLAWGVLALTVLWRAGRGLPAFARGASGPTRWALLAFGGWVLASVLLDSRAGLAWTYALTIASFMAAGQAILNWLDGDEGWRRRVLWGSFAGLFGFECLLSVLQWLHVDLSKVSAIGPVATFLSLAPLDSPGPRGSFGNPNFLSEWMGLVGPALVGWALTLERGRKAMLALVALGGVAVLTTYCRSTLLGVVPGLVLAALMVWGREADPRRWLVTPGRKKVAAGVALVTLVALGTVGSMTVHRIASLGVSSHGVTGNDTAARLLAYRTTVEIWQQRPVVGVGLGGFSLGYMDQVYADYPKQAPASATEKRFEQSHSDPLQVLAELGIVGLVLVLAAAVLWLWAVARNEALLPFERFGLLWGTITLFVEACVGFPFHVPTTALAAMAVMAMGLAGKPGNEGVTPLVGLARWTNVVAGVALVMLAGWAATSADALPLYRAAEHLTLGQRALAVHDASTVADILELSTSEDRYPAGPGFYLLRAYFDAGRFDEAIAAYKRLAHTGLGTNSDLIYGMALERSGKRQDAMAVYTKLLGFLPSTDPSYILAEERLETLQAQH